MLDKANRQTMNTDPEYEHALKVYMNKIDEYEHTKHTPDAPPINNAWCMMFCNTPASDDPKAVTNEYWRKHRPYIMRRGSSTMSASSDGSEDPDCGRYADDEYDEVRKVRMELEARLRETGAPDDF